MNTVLIWPAVVPPPPSLPLLVPPPLLAPDAEELPLDAPPPDAPLLPVPPLLAPPPLDAAPLALLEVPLLATPPPVLPAPDVPPLVAPALPPPSLRVFADEPPPHAFVNATTSAKALRARACVFMTTWGEVLRSKVAPCGLEAVPFGDVAYTEPWKEERRVLDSRS